MVAVCQGIWLASLVSVGREWLNPIVLNGEFLAWILSFIVSFWRECYLLLWVSTVNVLFYGEFLAWMLSFMVSFWRESYLLLWVSSVNVIFYCEILPWMLSFIVSFWHECYLLWWVSSVNVIFHGEFLPWMLSFMASFCHEFYLLSPTSTTMWVDRMLKVICLFHMYIMMSLGLMFTVMLIDFMCTVRSLVHCKPYDITRFIHALWCN